MVACQGLPKEDGLDLILHTPGGSIDAAEHIISYVRQLFGTNIRAIVPHMAMSAGSMMALACHSIIMGKHSAIGPIDPFVGQLSAQAILDEFNRAKKEMVDSQAAVHAWQPILSKYQPTLIEECERACELAKKLVRRWLKSGMFKARFESTPPQMTNDDLDEIVRQFFDLRETLGHGRHFDLPFIENLGLEITGLESDPALQDLVLSVHHCFTITFQTTVRVTSSTSVRVGGNGVGRFHDSCRGGARTNFESGRAGSGASNARAARVGVGGVRSQRDEWSKVCAVRGD